MDSGAEKEAAIKWTMQQHEGNGNGTGNGHAAEDPVLQDAHKNGDDKAAKRSQTESGKADDAEGRIGCGSPSVLAPLFPRD